nr:copia protein [Tanacetum cinerariifolium]
MKVEESLNVTFDETLPPSKTSPFEVDDLVEEEAIEFSKKQTALSISTTEAEYVSAEKACQQALWMKQALLNYGIRLDDIPIMYDNKGAIELSKNPVQHSRTKHTEIRHHFLRENVRKGNISIEKVSSKDKIADILTKPLKELVDVVKKTLEFGARGVKKGKETVTFHCKVMIEDVRRKSGWNYPSCGGEKYRKSVSRQVGKFLYETCYRTVDYPVLRYRLEVVVADDTAHTVVVMFSEITTELLNCSADSLIEAEDDVDDEASFRNQLITIDDPDPSFKRLARQPSMCTSSNSNEEKRNKRSEVEDSDTNKVLCLAKEPYEINADGPIDTKKRKI